jgi:hypothetical protein
MSFMLTTVLSCDENKTSEHDAIEDLWRIVGDVSLKKTKDAAIGAGDCKTGMVSGLHVDLCLFKDALSADAAKEIGLQRIGSHTGAALVRDRFLLVIADRDKVDVHGKTLNQVAKLFLQPIPES